jgi:hypothetical protein
MQQEIILIPSLKRQEEYCKAVKGRQRELRFTRRQSVQNEVSDQETPPLRDAPSLVWGISLCGRILLIDDMDPTEEVHMCMSWSSWWRATAIRGARFLDIATVTCGRSQPSRVLPRQDEHDFSIQSPTKPVGFEIQNTCTTDNRKIAGRSNTLYPCRSWASKLIPDRLDAFPTRAIQMFGLLLNKPMAFFETSSIICRLPKLHNLKALQTGSIYRQTSNRPGQC